MAETKLRQYAVVEKLNKMDVDLIDVTLTTDAEAHADNDVIAQSIEIPNAVAVKGGSAIIQSVMLLDEDDEAPSIDLIFQTDNTALASDEGEAINISDANARDILGFVNVSNYTDLIGCQVAVKTNIGLVVKAASTTKSIWVHAVNRSGGTYTPAATTDLKMRIGIVKD
tara:strand:- start:525 stop:1031 length:507 start_codon:yes stop_codon:yes gene_type:complete